MVLPTNVENYGTLAGYTPPLGFPDTQRGTAALYSRLAENKYQLFKKDLPGMRRYDQIEWQKHGIYATYSSGCNHEGIILCLIEKC